MPDRTTIVLPPRLKQLATTRAHERKISFSEFVRQAVEKAVMNEPSKRSRKKDPLFGEIPVYDGPIPSDVSENHDKYLYDEVD